MVLSMRGFKSNPATCHIYCRDPGLVKRIGAATAREARATGIPYVFAPCIAVYFQKSMFLNEPVIRPMYIISDSDLFQVLL